MGRHRLRILLLLVLIAVGVLLAVTWSRTGDVIVDFGVVPGPGAPPLPADAGVSVAGADVALAPEFGTVLEDGGWDRAAAFVAVNAAQGLPTGVNLFASWCGPCEREMPLLNAVAAEESGIVFLGVAHMDARRDAERFVAEPRIAFTTLLDLDGDVAYAVGGRGLPVTVAFDRDGVMVGRVFGELSGASLEELLRLVR